jgi:hypothetical protein
MGFITKLASFSFAFAIYAHSAIAAEDCGFPEGAVKIIDHNPTAEKSAFRDEDREEALQFTDSCSKLVVLEKRQNYQTNDAAFVGCPASVIASAKANGYTSCVQIPVLKTTSKEAGDLQRGEADPRGLGYDDKMYAYLDANGQLVFVQNWPSLPRQATVTYSTDSLNNNIRALVNEPMGYAMTVEGLSKLSCPKFADMNSEVMHSFQVGLGSSEQTWFQGLVNDVAKKSNGSVHIVQDDASHHKESCSCLGTIYAYATDGVKKVEFSFTPGTYDPFSCDPSSLVADPTKVGTNVANPLSHGVNEDNILSSKAIAPVLPTLEHASGAESGATL